MALSSVIDSDARFVVNGITRIISNNSSGKAVLIQGDHNSERLTFQVPRHVDGFDLSTCNVVQIHYINVSANKTKQGSDVYEVDDLAISSEDENAVTLSWLISSNATRYAGTLNFLIKFKCVNNDGKVVYVWNTATFTGISVSSGIDNGEVVVEEYSDILENWRKTLSANVPNWNAAADEEGYIENRTHYTDPDGTVHKLDNKYIDADWMATSKENEYTSVVISKQKMSGNSAIWSNLKRDIQPGITYAVHINDEVYMCVAHSAGDGVRLGNNTSLSANYIPFCITWAGGSATSGMFFTDGSFGSSCYLQVMGEGSTVKEYNKMPEEFLPECVVKSVNGTKPDEKGNVEVEGGADIDVTAAVGQTIIVKEVDANGKPTKWEGADYLEPLIGSTEEITPAQAAEALLAGRPIVLSFTDATFGTLVFNSITYCEAFGGAVQASQIFYMQGVYIASVLIGGGGTWTSYTTYLQPLKT